ncbi:protein-export chaperone SecB [Amylibacter kogurei]|uniref:Protein-export protein SecB n=1 Tax=Paramylibacter kogurei TaxID=1889778 RepID=A0A2G5KC07_9RHOB|nr:protein-export chaperone SecB [Amylibacter kogurei]PIB26563.1 protein-export chaperone SecB [Amylibacter kogurei]
MAKKEEAAAPQAPSMQCVNQYIRDMSFENIAAQKNIGKSVQPEISVQVNLDARKGGDDQYEVIQKLTVSAKTDEETVFLMELDYAGLFVIQNVPEDQLHPFLMIECPRMLFPFMRRIVRDVTADGGYPPLNVDNIDYLALYRAELQRRAAEEAPKN